MSTERILAPVTAIFLGIGTPFVVVHLMAAPDDAPISPLQHLVAALANFFGPWGVAIVRLVDFPNAGLRSFSWHLAVGLTSLGALLLVLLLKVTNRRWQILLTVAWGIFVLVWFGVGFTQIASGLL
ncbi:MAG TPA: hypothetical protein VJA21_18480 [Verrucomicrobiae bacterium]